MAARKLENPEGTVADPTMVRKLLNSLHREGLVGTGRRIVRFLEWRWWDLRGIIARPVHIVLESAFDARYGTDTRTQVRLDRLEIASPNRVWAAGGRGKYQGTRPGPLRRVLATVELPPEPAMIDFGCGKGRVLLVASEFPFKRIGGVEFSSELCEIARRNVVEYSRRTGRGAGITVVHGDAGRYPIEPDDNVFFFFNPFAAPVFEGVLANIRGSLDARPRRALLVYHNPDEPSVRAIEADGSWRRVREYRFLGSGRNFFVYETRGWGEP